MVSVRRSSRHRAAATYAEEQDSGSEMSEEEEVSEADEDDEAQESQSPPGRRKSSRRSSGSRRSTGRTPATDASARSIAPSSRSSLASSITPGEEEEQPHSELYTALAGDGMPNSVSEWITRYREDADRAILELVNLILEVTDCEGELGELPELEGDIVDVVEDLREQYDNSSGDYIASESQEMRKKVNKKRLANFRDLWNKIMVQGSNIVVAEDQNLLPVLVDWLIKLASSEVRPLRHTSTMVALDFLQACIDVASRSKKDLATADRQLSTEKKKKKLSATKIKQLEDRIEQTNKNLEVLEGTMRDIFDGIFVHRYRDIFEKIRVLCLDKLGDFIEEYPGMFLKDNYLKYLGWQLHDKVAEVRLACVKAVTTLYSNEDNHTHLDLFTTRFKERMLELQLDTDTDVSIKGMELSAALLKTEAMEEEEIGDTLGVLKHNDPKMRTAASAFVKAYMDLYSDTSEKLRVLLSICASDEAADDTSYVYVAEAMWDSSAVLKDWDTIVDMLLAEDEDGLNEQEQMRLMGLMVSSVKKACGRSTSGGDLKLPKKQREAVQRDREDLTTKFISALPKLMQRFQADETVMCELVQIPIYMDLSQYATARKKKDLVALVKHLRTTYTKHSDESLLTNIAWAFSSLIDPEFTLHKECSSVLEKLSDELANELGRHVEDAMSGNADDQEAAEYSLEVTLRRIGALYHKMDVRKPEVLQAVKACLAAGVDDEEALSEGVCIGAISVLHDYCIWDLQTVLDEDEVRADETKSVASRRDAVVEQLLSMQEAASAVRVQAFLSLIDLLMLYKQCHKQAPGLKYNVTPEISETITQWFENEMDQSENNLMYLKGMCQGVTNGALPLQTCAPAIVSHFVQHHKDCEDLIKSFTKDLKKKLPKSGIWSVELRAMKHLFAKYLAHNEERVFDDLKDLAAKIASAYPIMLKDKAHLSRMISGGIEFGLDSTPNNLPFLEAAIPPLARQCNKVQRVRCYVRISSESLFYFACTVQEHVSAFIEKTLEQKGLDADRDNEDWNPYFELQDMLENKRAVKNRGVARSSRRALPFDDGGVDEEDDEDSMESGEEHEAAQSVVEVVEVDQGGSFSSQRSMRASKRASQSLDEDSSLQVSQEFKPKLRASKANIPKRGSGFASRKRRRVSN